MKFQDQSKSSYEEKRDMKIGDDKNVFVKQNIESNQNFIFNNSEILFNIIIIIIMSCRQHGYP